jgi:hypothetical protein
MLLQIEVAIANNEPTPQACQAASITEQSYYRSRKEYPHAGRQGRHADRYTPLRVLVSNHRFGRSRDVLNHADAPTGSGSISLSPARTHRASNSDSSGFTRQGVCASFRLVASPCPQSKSAYADNVAANDRFLFGRIDRLHVAVTPMRG